MYIYIYIYTYKALIRIDLRLLNCNTASIYLKVFVFKKMRHLKRFTIISKHFILKPSAK